MPMRRSKAVLLAALMLGALLGTAGLPGLTAKPAAPVKHSKKSPLKPAAPAAPTAESLFVKVLQADDLFPYQGRQITTYWRTGRAVEVLVFHRPQDDQRIQFLNPERERGRLLVSDGTQQWEYEPRQKILRHRRLSLGALDDDDLLSYTLLRVNYLLAVDPHPRTIADRKTYLVTVKRPQGQTLARRFWIDSGSGVILKREIYGEDGKLIVTAGFSDITYHPAFAVGLFDLSTLARAVRVVELPATETAISLKTLGSQLAGTSSAPTALAGYRLVGATTTKIGLRPVLHLRYSDGLNLVSIFEQRRTQPGRPTLVPPGQRVVLIAETPVHVGHRASLTTLNWDTPTLNITLMGEMGLSALRALAQSVLQAHPRNKS